MNFTIEEKFRNFMEVYNAMELHVFQNELLTFMAYKTIDSSIAIVFCCCTLLLTCTVARNYIAVVELRAYYPILI